jgi:hypothetical protein
MPSRFKEKLRKALSARERLIFDRLSEGPQASADLILFLEKSHGLIVSKESVRQSIHGIRRKLARLYGTEDGVLCDERLVVTGEKKGDMWQLVTASNDVDNAVTLLWSGHLSNGRRTAILPYEFLYDRPADDLKHLNLADVDTVMGTSGVAVKRRAPIRYDDASRSGCVRTETAVAMLTIQRFLASHVQSSSSRLSPIIPTYEDVASFAADNLVILGPAGHPNESLNEAILERLFCLTIRNGVICRRLPRGEGWKEFYRSPLSEYCFKKHLGLFSVQGNRRDGRTITFIKATHPLALQALCNHLTNGRWGFKTQNEPSSKANDLWRTFQLAFLIHFSFGGIGVYKVENLVSVPAYTEDGLIEVDEAFRARESKAHDVSEPEAEENCDRIIKTSVR